MSKVSRKSIWLVVTILAVTILSACGTTSSQSASCAFVVGTGGGTDPNTRVHGIVYPGQTVTTGDYEVARYIACNSRNYIINPPDTKDAVGKPVGDRHTPIVAATNTGVQINIWARALWTLNQSDKVLREFYNVCFKYTCWSTADQGGTANFSTDGWNGMLGENFGPAMDQAGKAAAIQVNDDVWKNHDPKQYTILADSMSAAFSKAMQQNLGFSDDLFCGSGNSGWKDPAKPGQGVFECSNVRIVVDDVQLVANSTSQSSTGLAAINKQKHDDAEALYGPNAGDWLGLQDTIEKCRNSNTPCAFFIGGSGNGSSISIQPSAQSPSPAPSPAATATPGKK